MEDFNPLLIRRATHDKLLFRRKKWFFYFQFDILIILMVTIGLFLCTFAFTDPTFGDSVFADIASQI